MPYAALNSATFGPSDLDKKLADSTIDPSTNAVAATTIGHELQRQPTETTLSSAPAPDRFEVLEELGRGGMGLSTRRSRKG